MKINLKDILLNDDQYHQYVSEFLEEYRKVVDDPEAAAKIISPGERTARAQVGQFAGFLIDAINREMTREIKYRNQYSGKTPKTAIKREYWQGRIDLLGHLFVAIGTLKLEVANG